MMTDFYYNWTSTEREWAGQHYDFAMSGNTSAWKQANPTVGHLSYALLWSTMNGGVNTLGTSYYADMKSWYASHTQYSLENAFVHKKGTSKSAANRMTFVRWGSSRWIINPADAGAAAYTVSRIERIAAGDGGVMFDEASTGDIKREFTNGSLEFSSMDPYYAAFASILRHAKSGVGSKMLMMNTAEYTTPADSTMAVAAGATHLEMINNFKNSGMVDRWEWIEHLNNAGVFVDMVSAYSSYGIPGMTNYPRGNSATNTQRAKLWELASYYMAVQQSSPKLLAIQMENFWSIPYSQLWIKAQQANIGHPVAPRHLVSEGTDSQGNRYQIWARSFERALVLLRLQQGWGSQTYGDGTAVDAPMPSSSERWLPLNADGTVSSPVTSIKLRQSEAAIILRGSTM